MNHVYINDRVLGTIIVGHAIIKDAKINICCSYVRMTGIVKNAIFSLQNIHASTDEHACRAV